MQAAEKMLMAGAIVFAAPNYGGFINAIGHACLERTFCFSHRGAFSLSGKLGIAVSTSYTCGFGHNCSVGHVIKENDPLDKIEKKHPPPSFEEQEDTILQAGNIGKLLRAYLVV